MDGHTWDNPQAKEVLQFSSLKFLIKFDKKTKINKISNKENQASPEKFSRLNRLEVKQSVRVMFESVPQANWLS